MAKVKVPFNSFQFGELSPSFTSRVDTQLYQAGAQKVRNFLILGEGGVKKRPGTEFIYEFSNARTPSNPMEVRIEPFIFSDTERYIFAFSNQKLDIFTIDTSDNSVSYTMSLSNSDNCPWTTEKLSEITFASSGDVTFICHTSFPPKIIRRTASDTFVTEDFAFETLQLGKSTPPADAHLLIVPKQPYFDFQPAGVTLTPSSFTEGTLRDLVAKKISDGTTYPYFTTDHVGKWLLLGSVPVLITNYTSSTTVRVTIPDGGIYRELAPDSAEVFSGVSFVRVTMALHNLKVGDSVTVSRLGALGGITQTQIEGAFTVSEIIDENTFEYNCGHNANSSAIGGGSMRVATVAPTTEWYEQSYSDIRGYPGAVTFFEGRLWFAGTTGQPDHIWASKSNEFFNFSIGGGAANDAIDIASSFGEFSQIRHLVSNRDLQVFSASSEAYIPAVTSAPITPATALIKRQTPFGCSFARPQPFDGATLYTQASGEMLGSFVYSEVEQAYNTQNVSQTASHLMQSPLQSASIKGGFDRSESYMFLVNPEGSLSVFYSSRGDQKAGWMKWDTPGEFHSICVVDRQLFTVAVRDNGNGTNLYYLEEFKDDMPMDFCKYRTNGVAGVFDVSDQYANNAKVKIVSGTDYLGEYTVGEVTTGKVDVSAVKDSVTAAYVGYQFNPILKTLPIDIFISGDSLTGRPRKIDMVTLDLLDTLSVAVNNKNMVLRNVNDDFSLDRANFTGKKEFRLIGLSRDPVVEITQSVPFGLQLNGMVVEVSF
jgi:hypothetical protein